MIYDSLQLREIFHLEFLRWLGRKIKINKFALKGGVNLRFFFGSIRYSEDMDLDVVDIELYLLIEKVMEILTSPSFKDILKPFGIENFLYPDIKKAKQTETTQRFKIHLITFSGEDLFTKIEFSRRGIKGKVVVEPVLNNIIRNYKLTPIIFTHYDISSMINHKINALAHRAITQPRDIFDLYILNAKYDQTLKKTIDQKELKKASENLFAVSFEEFRDKVVSYLSLEDQRVYNIKETWDEIQLKTANFLEELKQ